MSIRGLNHLTLTVADLERSVAFYREVLEFELRAMWATGAYLEAGTLWLCLSAGDGSAPTGGETHYAFDVTDAEFGALAERIRRTTPPWKENSSEGASVYFLDPDGHRLELHVGSLASRLAHYSAHPDKGVTVVRG